MNYESHTKYRLKLGGFKLKPSTYPMLPWWIWWLVAERSRYPPWIPDYTEKYSGQRPAVQVSIFQRFRPFKTLSIMLTDFMWRQILYAIILFLHCISRNKMKEFFIEDQLYHFCWLIIFDLPGRFQIAFKNWTKDSVFGTCRSYPWLATCIAKQLL